jgi:glutamyl/glutaminyl-tRNA synthetase
VTEKRYTRTRIAPTPSGYLHLGNVLSFAITATLAHKHGAKILLRIDDLDRARANKLYIQDIFDTLNFLQIPWDEGPRDVKDFEQNYSQLHRMDNYREALDKLRDAGLVFACTCSRKQINTCNCMGKHIPLATPGASWRLHTNNHTLTVNGYNRDGIMAALTQDMQNFIVKKKDGFPAYQLTSVIDDLLYGIDLVVRGYDLWPSTVAQHQLAAALGKGADLQAINFYHHPLIMGTSGQKLSKSAGDTSVKYLRESGKTPADIFATIAGMLGKTNISNWQQLGDAAII